MLEIDRVMSCQILGTKNRNFQHCKICVIVPVNSLRHDDVIINKKHGTFDLRQHFSYSTEAEERLLDKETHGCVSNKPSTLSGLSYTYGNLRPHRGQRLR